MYEFLLCVNGNFITPNKMYMERVSVYSFTSKKKIKAIVENLHENYRPDFVE